LVDLVTIGHVLTDVRMFVDRFPGPDEETKTDDLSIGGGGSAANVAVGASRLGVKSGFIGTIGFDTFGQALLEDLKSQGVDVSNVKVETTVSSGLTFIAVDRKGEVIMFGYTGASDKLSPADLNKNYIAGAEHVHITGLSFETALAAANMAKEAKVVVSFDPGRLMSQMGLKKLSPLLNHVDQVLLNNEEAAELTGEEKLEDAAKLLIELGPKKIIIKKGANGVFAMTPEENFTVPVYPVDVVDTTGAGDAFSSGFITAQLEGKDMKKSVEFANVTANLKVTKSGARSLPTRKEVEKFLAANKS